MGPNGSGKSTLANAIMGHPSLALTDGQILFNGEDVTEADPDERSGWASSWRSSTPSRCRA